MTFSKNILLAIFIALLSAGTTAHLVRGPQGEAESKKETAYERVLRTKTLRCGYADWPPHVLIKNPTTGEVTGILHDVVEAAAAKMGLKVDWSENVGWGTFIESLQTGRVDAFCAGGWRNAERGRYLIWSVPVFYSAIYPYVREGDHRFDADLSLADDPSVRLSTMDGEQTDIIAREYFPKAKRVASPQLGQAMDLLVNVGDGKADLITTESSFANAYMKANPGKLRRAQDKPFQVFETAIAFEIHETLLRDMFDSAISELHNLGTIEKIISKYSADKTEFVRVARPYQF